MSDRVTRKRIPLGNYAMIAYALVIRDYLNKKLDGSNIKRGIELGMTQDELDFIDDFIKSLISGDLDHPGIWDLHSNKDTKTQKTTADLNDAKNAFCAFFRPILNRIAISAVISNGDRIALEISDPVVKHKKPEKITKKCFASLTAQNFAEYKVECRSESDSKRAGKPTGANKVEVAILIEAPVIQTTVSGTNVVVPPTIKEDIIPDNIVLRVFSSKARFTLKLGGSNIRSTANLYFRWTNDKYPELSGPWSLATVFAIS